MPNNVSNGTSIGEVADKLQDKDYQLGLWLATQRDGFFQSSDGNASRKCRQHAQEVLNPPNGLPRYLFPIKGINFELAIARIEFFSTELNKNVDDSPDAPSNLIIRPTSE